MSADRRSLVPFVGSPGGVGSGLAVGRDIAALRSSGGGATDPGSLVGAEPHNMAPTNAKIPEVSTNNVHVLSFGIDSIWLNVYGSISEDLHELLSWAKEDAQKSPTKRDLAPLPPFLGSQLQMEPRGAKLYDYVVRSDDLRVEIKGPGGLQVAPMVIRISSECLWRLGGGGWPAIDAVVEWAHEVFSDGCEVRLSKFHQCGDIQGWVPTVGDLCGIVRRADTVELYDADGNRLNMDGLEYRLAKSDALESLAAGRSNRLRISIYDKTKEIKKTGKTWFSEVWAQSPDYDASLPVWRIEPQYGREFLHKYNIETLDDLRAQQDTLFRYGLAWFSWRERQETDLTHPDRWPLVPAWAALAASRPVSGSMPIARVRAPKLARLSQGAYGYLTSIMAITGETDEEAALERLLAIVRLQKGSEGMEKVVAKKRQAYAPVLKRAHTERERLGRLAAASVPTGTGYGALHARMRQWGVGGL